MAVKKSSKKTSPKSARKRAPAGKRSASPPPRKIRPGYISHTEIASANPGATKVWLQEVLGWKFLEPMPTPNGPYHMWTFGNNTGGGLRTNNLPETPGSIPYVEVVD